VAVTLYLKTGKCFQNQSLKSGLMVQRDIGLEQRFLQPGRACLEVCAIISTVKPLYIRRWNYANWYLPNQRRRATASDCVDADHRRND
jgi:hypothetical protein